MPHFGFPFFPVIASSLEKFRINVKVLNLSSVRFSIRFLLLQVDKIPPLIPNKSFVKSKLGGLQAKTTSTNLADSGGGSLSQ